MTLAELPLGDNPPPPPLAALAPRQPNLVSVGSLSKLYWGGLRTGWVSASAGLIARVAAAKAAADLGSAAFPQAIAAALLNDEHDDIVKWRRRVAAGQARRADRGPASRPARVDVARAGRRPHPVGAPAQPGPAGRQRRVRPGRAQARGRRGPRPPAECQRRRASGGGTGQASEYLRLAFTQAPDVLARSAVALAAASSAQRVSCYTRAVPIRPFLVTRAASSSAARPPVPAGRAGSTM